MFLNVIMGNLSTFTVFQGHIFWSRSNKYSIMCILWYIIGIPNVKVINIMVIEILQKRWNFDISLLGEWCYNTIQKVLKRHSKGVKTHSNGIKTLLSTYFYPLHVTWIGYHRDKPMISKAHDYLKIFYSYTIKTYWYSL